MLDCAAPWGRSSAGRASRSQCEGREFDPPRLHHRLGDCDTPVWTRFPLVVITNLGYRGWVQKRACPWPAQSEKPFSRGRSQYAAGAAGGQAAATSAQWAAQCASRSIWVNVMSLLDELKKPYNLFTTLFSVGALAVSVYITYASIQKREPLFFVRSQSQIVNAKVSSPKFRVVDSDGSPVEGDIHVLELSFWNSGRLPIEPSDIRTPVAIRFPQGHRILDALVVAQTKPQVTNFAVSVPVKQDSAGPRVDLTWAHLDPGLGARLQVIFAGKALAEVSFEGDILDAEIENAHSPLRRNTNELTRAFLCFLVLVGSWGLGSVVFSRIYLRSRLLEALLLLPKAAIFVGLPAFGMWLLFAPKSAPI